MARNEHTQKQEEKSAPAPEDESRAYRAHVPAELRNVSFPLGVRGYDRKAVEDYVHRVNRVIAELEITRSPQAAVRHAVERVGEQTKTILDEARESAEKISATAQAEADEIIAQAKAKAADLVVESSTEADRMKAESDELVSRSKSQAEQIIAAAKRTAEERRRESEQELGELQAQAEARMSELEADTASVWDRRDALLTDIDRMAAQLHDAAREAAGRFARVGSEEPEVSETQQTAILPGKQPTKSKKKAEEPAPAEPAKPTS
jgi:DivIVA domain-containing protein